MNLKDYIRGKRHGEAANRLEREAMEDPFLQDAIDGYDSVEGDHYSAIQKLEQQLTQPRKRVNKRVWIAAAAALLLLLIGIPFLLRPPQQLSEPLVATTDTRVEKEIVKERTAEEETVEEKTVKEETEEEQVVEEKSVEEKSKTLEEIVVAQATEESKELMTIQATGTTGINGATKETEEPEPRSIPALALAQQALQSTTSDTARKRVTATVKKSMEERMEEARVTSAGEWDHLLVSGRVLDETGEPVIGAIVSLENSMSGTVTDTDGMFRLPVPKGEKGTLIAEYVGMKKLTFPLKENVGDITLKADDLALNETVIVGFGTMKKADKVGSTAALKEPPTRADTQTMDQSIMEKAKEFDATVFETKAFGRRDAKAIEPGKKDTETKAFGEKEFKEFFAKHYDKSLCQGDSIAFTVTFSIRSDGRPAGIQIQKNSCPGLETEIKRLLLGSPPWTNTNRKVTLTVEIPGS